MKLPIFVSLSILVATGFSATAQFWGGRSGEIDNRTLVVILPDGTCAITNQNTEPRKMLEMQLASWEMSQKHAEGSDEDTPGSNISPSPGQKAFTDQEITSKVREMRESMQQYGMQGELTVDDVKVTSNTVEIVTSQRFPSLKDLLSQHLYNWGPSMLMVQNARAELDTNKNLRLTFSVPPEAARHLKEAARQWKNSKAKFDWKLVLPGKILSSTLPRTEDKATWITIDPEKPETVDFVAKILGQTVVITAEPAGLKVDQPLDSAKLVREAWRPDTSEPDVPVTDAGPGYIAEPVGLTLSTLHLFPEGEKYFKDRSEAYMFGGLGSTGTMVSAKLFPPKGRIIRSLSEAQVKSAKDDKGRAIPLPRAADDEEVDYAGYSRFTQYESGESEEKSGLRFDLRMGLPAPDARSIDEVVAEAVALTIGGWKVMTVQNVKADTNAPIDLSQVLPGAKLTIKKVSRRSSQTTIQARIEGPKEVAQLDLKIKVASRQRGNSHVSQQRSTVSGGKTIRSVSLQSWDFESANGGGDKEPPTIIVRFPQDPKRERVQFKLTGLDLL